MKEHVVDAVIVGNGPAGVSAALYMARANLSLAVLSKGESALARAERIENYYGLSDAPSGEALWRAGLAQLTALKIPQVEDEVVGISYDTAYRVQLQGGDVYIARALLLCTGAQRVRPAIAGLPALEGKGVSYCAVCDAFFFRGKDVAVLGNGPYALHEAETLRDVVKSVTILTDGKASETEFPPEMPLISTKIASLNGTETLTAVAFADGTELPVSGLFVALGVAGASDLARKLGAEVRGTDVVTDSAMATLLPGLYAAGDCTGGVLQVSIAVAEGAKAALSAIRFLRGGAA